MVELKYKEFKLLSQEDKEEYIFRREHNSSMLWSMQIISMVWKIFYYVFTFIMIFFLFVKDSLQESWQDLMTNMVVAISSYLEVILIITAFLLMVNVLSILLDLLILRKWKKEKGYDVKFKEAELERMKNRKK